MILSPMFKFHLLVPAAERGERSEHSTGVKPEKIGQCRVRASGPVCGGQWATGPRERE